MEKRVRGLKRVSAALSPQFQVGFITPLTWLAPVLLESHVRDTAQKRGDTLWTSRESPSPLQRGVLEPGGD